MKKILFVINTMGRAGAETALINLINKLLSMKEYEISLYAIIPRGELFARVPKEVHILNKRCSCDSVLSLSGRLAIMGQAAGAFFKHFNGFKMLPEMIRNILAQKKETGRIQPDKALWRLLAASADAPDGEYDLGVAYIEGAAAYYLADKVRAKQKAAFIHIDYQKAGYTPAMDQGCYDKIQRIFTVSDEVKEKFCGVYPQYREKTMLFRNLLDQERIRQRAKETGFTDGFKGIRLVTVGRLHYQKGYDIAIEACAKLREMGYDIRWNILGDGPERANLEKQIAQLGMQEHFILMGAVDNPYPYVNEATIYVHATRFEGKSIAIEEAQVLGKTIVASDCTGNTEQIIHGHDGLLLTLNAENLTNTLKYALDHPEVCEELRRNVLHKQLDHPEDLQAMLAMME
ncbi:MAG: glycosyltransferase [Clostridiales bacterium]|nr:glycosyltransferase [Clostridiales bacterium]